MYVLQWFCIISPCGHRYIRISISMMKNLDVQFNACLYSNLTICTKPAFTWFVVISKFFDIFLILLSFFFMRIPFAVVPYFTIYDLYLLNRWTHREILFTSRCCYFFLLFFFFCCPGIDRSRTLLRRRELDDRFRPWCIHNLNCAYIKRTTTQ